MKLTIDTKILIDTIKAMERALGTMEFVSLVASDKELILLAQNEGKSVSCSITQVSISAKGECTLPAPVFVGILKNRKEISLDLSKDKLYFKAGSSKDYAGHILVVPFQKIKLESGKVSIEFKDKDIEKINELIAAISLTDIHLKAANVLPICIKLSEKGLEASCATKHHFAYAHDKTIKFKEDQDFCISSDIIPTLANLAKNESYSLSVTESSVYAANSLFKARFSLQQFDRFVTLDHVKLVINKFKTEDLEAEVSVATATLNNTINNLISIYEENAPIEFSVEGKKFRACTKTKFGSVNEKVEGSASGSTKEAYLINPYLLNDCLKKCKSETLNLGLHGQKSISIMYKIDSVSYISGCWVVQA